MLLNFLHTTLKLKIAVKASEGVAAIALYLGKGSIIDALTRGGGGDPQSLLM